MIHVPFCYSPQTNLREGNVSQVTVCLQGGGKEQQMHHGIGDMVWYFP